MIRYSLIIRLFPSNEVNYEIHNFFNRLYLVKVNFRTIFYILHIQCVIQIISMLIQEMFLKLFNEVNFKLILICEY